MPDFASKYAVCPFYRRSDSNRICCEGTSRNNTIHLVFGNQNKLKDYTADHCNSMDGYRHCRICKMLSDKYPPNTSI